METATTPKWREKLDERDSRRGTNRNVYLLLARRFGASYGKPLRGIVGAPRGPKPDMVPVRTRGGKDGKDSRIVMCNRHHLKEEFEEKQEIKRYRAAVRARKAQRQARKIQRRHRG